MNAEDIKPIELGDVFTVADVRELVACDHCGALMPSGAAPCTVRPEKPYRVAECKWSEGGITVSATFPLPCLERAN